MNISIDLYEELYVSAGWKMTHQVDDKYAVYSEDGTQIGEPRETWKWWFIPRLLTEVISFLMLFAFTVAEIES